jgi:hypothetical protein
VGLLQYLFGRKTGNRPKEPDHAVIVHFRYAQADLQPLFNLEDQLQAAIAKAGVGEFDGNEIAVDGGDGFLYMYGPDADKLFAVVKPILTSVGFMAGATVKLRYGPDRDDVLETEVEIEALTKSRH